MEFCKQSDGTYLAESDGIIVRTRRCAEGSHRWAVADDGSDRFWGRFPGRRAAAQELITQGWRERANEMLGHMSVSTSFDDTRSHDTDEWSEGAQFCLSLWKVAREMWESGECYRIDDSDVWEATFETVSSMSEMIYMHQSWKTFVDLIAYSSAEAAEIVQENNYASMTDMVQNVLCDMGRNAVTSLIREWREERDSLRKRVAEHGTGCWLDGAHGWHNGYRVVDIATEYGYVVPAEYRASLERYRTNSGSIDDHEAISGQGGLCDMAMEYLNGLVPDGTVLEWDMGALSLVCSVCDDDGPCDDHAES